MVREAFWGALGASEVLLGDILGGLLGSLGGLMRDLGELLGASRRPLGAVWLA